MKPWIVFLLVLTALGYGCQEWPDDDDNYCNFDYQCPNNYTCVFHYCSYKSSSNSKTTEEEEDDIYRDSNNGLRWQKDVNLLTDVNLLFDDGLLNWRLAKDYCDNLTLGGYDDWRLPVLGELKSLTYGNEDEDCHWPSDFDDGLCWSSFWSSESTLDGKIWTFNFLDGEITTSYKDDEYLSVRCVR